MTIRGSIKSFAALFAAILALWLGSVSPSCAQDPFADFFGGLFGAPSSGGQTHPSRPRVRRIMPHQENRPPTYWRGGEAARPAPKRAAKRTEQPSPGAKADQPESAASYFVAVMGDTLALQLSPGLEEILADRPEIGVLGKAKENSGLVRDDFYDWPKTAKEIANGSQKVDVAVVMIGSNDRQSIRSGAQNEEAFSPRWREIYAARVDAMLAAFREKKIPVVWVGLPVMKNESYSADMAKLNEIFREQAAKSGAVYVDLWEALADEKGQFSAFGPDINGQIVKLRAADGVHFTDAGALSVAHFVASEIKKLYDGHRRETPEPAPVAATPPAGASPAPETAAAPAAPVVFRSPIKPVTSEAPALPDRPAIGPAQPLTAAFGAGDSELARRTPAAVPSNGDAQALARHVFVEGGAQPARANRADDDSWKAPTP